MSEEKVDTRPWCWNVENRERYERAESREEALLEAVKFYARYYCEDPAAFARSAQDTVQLGRLNLYRFSYPGEWIMELMAQNAEDECGGDAAEDWPDASQADVAALGEAVDKVIQEWIERTGNTPTFGLVDDIEHPTYLEVEAVIRKHGITTHVQERE